jgi:hypothetical protein
MHRYIQQLIADFNKAEQYPVKESDFGSSYEDFEKAMLSIETDMPSPSKDILGVSYEELPPPERLSVAQMQELMIALLNALAAKGTHVSFPGNGIPVELAYREVRELFKEGFHAMPGWNIDFCSGDCPTCAFVDYCSEPAI